jgi:hypothetical protein
LSQAFISKRKVGTHLINGILVYKIVFWFHSPYRSFGTWKLANVG